MEDDDEEFVDPFEIDEDLEFWERVDKDPRALVVIVVDDTGEVHVFSTRDRALSFIDTDDTSSSYTIRTVYLNEPQFSGDKEDHH